MSREIKSIDTVFVVKDISVPTVEWKQSFTLINDPTEVQVSQITFSDENTQNHPAPPTSFIISNLVIEPNNILFSFIPTATNISTNIIHRLASSLENVEFKLQTFKNDAFQDYNEQDIDITGTLSFCLTFIEYV